MKMDWLSRIALLLGVVMFGGSAGAEELNDKMVSWLTQYASAAMLDRYTTPEHKVVTIDKKKPEEFQIPLEDARQVIKVAYNTARAQVCHLKDKEAENSEALIKHAQMANKWTDKQLFFIRELQLFVVQITVGTIRITQEGDNKKIELMPKTETLSKVHPCNEDEAKKLTDTIDAYVKEVKQ